MLRIRADYVLIFLMCLLGGACLSASYPTLRKGRGAASFGLIFSGLLFLLIAGLFLTVSAHMPD